MKTWRLQHWDDSTKAARLCLFLLISCLLPATSHAAPPPVITVQPLDQTVTSGGTATFTVTATSSTALTYQWYKDGLLILDYLLIGETRSTLILNNVGNSEVGQYFVKVSNAGGTVTSRKASLTVVGNSPPVANNDNYSTLEDVSLNIPAGGVLTNDTDINGQALTPVVLTNVAQGSLSLSTNGAFTYLPPTNFAGVVSFTYCAADGYPVLLEQNASGADDRQISAGSKSSQSFKHGSAGGSSYMINKVVLYLSRRPGGSGNLNFGVGTGVNAGDVAGSSNVISTASITNTSDGSSFQTYTIVYGAPIGPFTAGTTYYLNLDNQASERFYVEYPNNNTYANGTYYEGGTNQNKDMRFQIYETVVSSPATVTINVLPVQDPPVAGNDTKSAQEDTSVTIKVLANDYDPDGAPLTITGVHTTNGTAVISGTGTNIIFRAATNFNGPVVFNYTISDGSASATGRVTVAVAPMNDAPIAFADNYTCPENMTLTVPVAGPLSVGTSGAGILANDSDVDGDPFNALLVADVSHGKLSLNLDGSFTYAPNENYVGSDAFTYVACDGPDDSPVTTVTINVTPVSDPLRFISQQMTPKGFELQLAGPGDSTYVLLASANHTNWTPISTNYTASGYLVFTDTDAANHPLRFYRAMVVGSTVAPLPLP